MHLASPSLWYQQVFPGSGHLVVCVVAVDVVMVVGRREGWGGGSPNFSSSCIFLSPIHYPFLLECFRSNLYRSTCVWPNQKKVSKQCLIIILFVFVVLVFLFYKIMPSKYFWLLSKKFIPLFPHLSETTLSNFYAVISNSINTMIW